MKIMKMKILKQKAMTLTKTWMMITRDLPSRKKTSCAPYKTNQAFWAVGSCWLVN